MRVRPFVLFATLAAFAPDGLASQGAPRTLVAILAHADDEDPAGPILARYAREGVQVYLLIATDGSRGTGCAAARGDTVAADQDARARALHRGCVRRSGAWRGAPPLLVPGRSVFDRAGCIQP